MNVNACIPATDPGLISTLLADTDCQAFGLVERGYAALSAPGSATSATVTALMVIAVALFGYQLMLGRTLVIADLTRLALRLGVVMLLATAWSTMQGAAYDTLARAPTRIASDLVGAIDAPAPLAGIQDVLDKIEQASIGWRQRAGIASPLVGGPPTTAMALNVTGFLLTITTLGLLVVSRVVLALLLAITPVIAGFFLFDATRGLVEGWLRAMIAAALVPIGVLTLAAVELSILAPLLDRILAQQAGGQYLEQSVTPLALVAIVFALASLATLAALRSIARGIRLPGSRTPAALAADAVARADAVAAAATVQQVTARTAAEQQPSVVRALEIAQRRDADRREPDGAAPTAVSRPSYQRAAVRQALPVAGRFEPAFRGVTPLQPRLRNRTSRAARRRDA